MGMPPTEWFKLRRQKAAAAGKKNTTSLSLFMEAYGLDVRRFFRHGHAVLGGKSLDWKLATRTKRSVDQANSRCSDVEAGKRRTCRSCDGVKLVIGHFMAMLQMRDRQSELQNASDVQTLLKLFKDRLAELNCRASNDGVASCGSELREAPDVQTPSCSTPVAHGSEWPNEAYCETREGL